MTQPIFVVLFIVDGRSGAGKVTDLTVILMGKISFCDWSNGTIWFAVPRIKTKKATWSTRDLCACRTTLERTNKMRAEGKTSERDAAGKNLHVITVFGALLDFQMCNNEHERASKHNCSQQASNIEWSNQTQTLAYFRFRDNPIGSKWARFILRRAHVKPLQCNVTRNDELPTSRGLRNAVCADRLNTVATEIYLLSTTAQQSHASGRKINKASQHLAHTLTHRISPCLLE